LILEYLSSYCTCIDISGSQYTSLILAPNPSFYIGNFVEICQKIHVLFMVVTNGKIVSSIQMVTTIVLEQLKATLATATIEVTVIILTPPTTIILIRVITIMVLETTIVTILPRHSVISIILSLFLTLALKWNRMITSSSLQKLNCI
jgi:hypothetical protein